MDKVYDVYERAMYLVALITACSVAYLLGATICDC